MCGRPRSVARRRYGSPARGCAGTPRGRRAGGRRSRAIRQHGEVPLPASRDGHVPPGGPRCRGRRGRPSRRGVRGGASEGVGSSLYWARLADAATRRDAAPCRATRRGGPRLARPSGSVRRVMARARGVGRGASEGAGRQLRPVRKRAMRRGAAAGVASSAGQALGAVRRVLPVSRRRLRHLAALPYRANTVGYELRSGALRCTASDAASRAKIRRADPSPRAGP